MNTNFAAFDIRFNIMSVSDKYRNYYKMDKPFAKWEKGRTKPEWF